MLASKSLHIEVLCIALVAGCMKIYPDPELPDLEVNWFGNYCRSANAQVSITLEGLDDATVQRQLTVACADANATIEDVPRQRYKLIGSLFNDAGEESGHSESNLDMRNGLDEEAFLPLAITVNYRVAWEFVGGATCESLGVDTVKFEFLRDGQPRGFSIRDCVESSLVAYAPEGMSSAIARGYRDGAAIAASPMVDVTIDSETTTDLGTFVLSPCGEPCP